MIWSESEIRKYVENVLPELKLDEVFVSLLFFRSKYVFLNNENLLLDRKIIRTNDPDLILLKVKKMVSQSHFSLKTGEELPVEGKVLYFDPNPKSTLKAYNKFVRDVNSNIYSIYKAMTNDKQVDFTYFRKMDINLFSCIHGSKSRQVYWLLDFDTKDEDMLNRIHDILFEYTKCIIETRNGYHMLVVTKEGSGYIVYNKVKDKFVNIEYKKDFADPLPGTLQGGFKVSIKYLNEDLQV